VPPQNGRQAVQQPTEGKPSCTAGCQTMVQCSMKPRPHLAAAYAAGVRYPHSLSASAAGQQSDIRLSAFLRADERILARPLQPDAHNSLNLPVP